MTSSTSGPGTKPLKLHRHVIEELTVRPGEPAGLSGRSTSETKNDWLGPAGLGNARSVAASDLEAFKEELAAAQELLYSSDTWAVLVILQALDAAGKDGTIKHVMSGVNPQGCEVVSFKQPSADDLSHDFLWRCAKVLPARGHIGIFNRSYYEEVLVAQVHPELLSGEHLPRPAEPSPELWRQRYDDINAFEHHLQRNGTRVMKFFLHVSKEEQKRRFLERLDDPAKHWKVSTSDLAERAHFETYQRAYEEALSATSTPWAPWHVVPADHKYAMRALVGGVLTHAIEQLDLRMPEPSEQRLAELAAAKRALLAEGAKDSDR
jgi:PPK2 family polyphosphate:nucleotide phosphotransferase